MIADSKRQTIQPVVLVIGGGLVGAAQAIAFAAHGVRTEVVDVADPEQALDTGFDGRASAIALATQRVLAAIGVWDKLGDLPAPILDIRVSDGPSRLFLHYDHREIGDGPFGYMVENRHMWAALLTRMREIPHLRLRAPATVLSLTRARKGIEADLGDGTTVRAALAVGAEGRRSPSREAAGIKVTRWNYGQTGIVCTVRHAKSHGFVAQEHFLPAGPFAILPLNGDGDNPGNLSSIVWTERQDLAPALLSLDDAEFKAELDRRFGDFLGETEIVGPRWSYPLSLQYAETAISQRLALIGDASHGMHPIAGQGFNMGLRDVAALAEVVIDAHRIGEDIGSTPVLERYERWRRFDNTLMLATTDGLNRLFSNDIGPVTLARDLGLAAVNAVPPLKRFFMRHAMGLVGDLPRLMQGRPL